MKNIPGRKTDQNDAEWIADLLAHGLLRASFVPPAEIEQLRDWTRYRVKLMQEYNRIHKVLEDANLKLSSVASDILGATGRPIVTAVIRGQQHHTRTGSRTRRSAPCATCSNPRWMPGKKTSTKSSSAWITRSGSLRLSISLSAGDGALLHLNRYEARLRHQYERPFRELRRLQAERNPPQPPVPPSPEPTQPQPPAGTPPIAETNSTERTQARCDPLENHLSVGLARGDAQSEPSRIAPSHGGRGFNSGLPTQASFATQPRLH